MWIVKGLLSLLALIVLAIFFTQNSGQTVDIRFFRREFLDIPLYYVLILSFLIGLAVSIVVGSIREIRLRSQLRRLGKDLRERDREITELRALPLSDLPAEPNQGE